MAKNKRTIVESLIRVFYINLLCNIKCPYCRLYDEKWVAGLQLIKVNSVNLGIKLSVMPLLPRDLVVALWHVKPCLGRQFILHHG